MPGRRLTALPEPILTPAGTDREGQTPAAPTGGHPDAPPVLPPGAAPSPGNPSPLPPLAGLHATRDDEREGGRRRQRARRRGRRTAPGARLLLPGTVTPAPAACPT